MTGSSGVERRMANPPLTWFAREDEGWAVDFLNNREAARNGTSDSVLVVAVERRTKYSTFSGNLVRTNHDFSPETRTRLRGIVDSRRKACPYVRAVVEAASFLLRVPNEQVERVREGLREILSESKAYQWVQRPLAASRRGIVREVEEDEIEREKLYPVREFFG